MIPEELKAQMVGVVRDWRISEEEMTPSVMRKVMNEALLRLDNLTGAFLWGCSDRDKRVKSLFYESLHSECLTVGEQE